MVSKHEHTQEQEMARYLDHVETGLRALPREARDAEIEEIEQHIRSLAVAHEELGLPPQEATRAALRQFGTASQVARTLVRAWKRGQERLLPGTLGSAVCWGTMTTIATILAQYLLNFMFPIVLGTAQFLLAARMYGQSVASALLTGYVVGCKAPRYALRGSLLVWLMFLTLNVGIFFGFTLPHIPAAYLPEMLPRYLVLWAANSVIHLGIMLSGARLGRRRHRTGSRMRPVG
jgi:hypothetical protein